MKPSNSSKPAAEIVAAIRALDLDPIKVKLMDAEDGQGWTREYAERMEVAYKRFLTLLVTHPETTVAPSKEIDKFWHAHILDTMKYAEDCLQVFGYFLHHFPYFGLRGADDAAQLERAGQDMEQLYMQEFGEAMPDANSAYCAADKPQAKTAYCAAAKPQSKSAYCAADKPQAGAAYCAAGLPQAVAAYCAAAIPQAKTAYCAAGKPRAQSSYCASAKPQAKTAYCAAAKPDLVTRPVLAAAA